MTDQIFIHIGQVATLFTCYALVVCIVRPLFIWSGRCYRPEAWSLAWMWPAILPLLVYCEVRDRIDARRAAQRAAEQTWRDLV